MYSCTTVKLPNRKGKDIVLSSDNFMQLNGIYTNNSSDSTGKRRNLWNNFETDSLNDYSGYKVSIFPNDLNSLKLKIFYEDSIVFVTMLGGHYKDGYFAIEREWTTEFIAGPAIWFLNNNIRYIGLDKNNNLVVLNSGNKLLILLMMFPVKLSKVQHENIYKRSKLVNVK